MIVYETRNHWFIMDDGRKVELTKREHDLLIAISSGDLATYDDIDKHVFGNKSKKHMPNIRGIKCRLEKKANIRIETKEKQGFILRTEIYFK